MTCVSPLFNIDRLSNLTYKSILWNLKGKKNVFLSKQLVILIDYFLVRWSLNTFSKPLSIIAAAISKRRKKMTHNLSLITSKKRKHYRQIQKVVSPASSPDF